MIDNEELLKPIADREGEVKVIEQDPIIHPVDCHMDLEILLLASESGMRNKGPGYYDLRPELRKPNGSDTIMIRKYIHSNDTAFLQIPNYRIQMAARAEQRVFETLKEEMNLWQHLRENYDRLELENNIITAIEKVANDDHVDEFGWVDLFVLIEH